MKLCLVSQLALVVSFLPPALAQDVESSLFSASTSHHQINNAFAAPTLVELTASNPHLSTLVMAKHSADFSHLLGNTGKNYTFFAPDNNAFNYLQQQTPELARALFTAPWLDHLQNLLSFHIVDSEQAIHTSSVQESTTVHTLAGEPVYLTPYQDALYIWPALHGGYARVVTPDNGSANGVAHYVDAILMPSWLTRSIWQTISAANMRDLTTFKRLIDKADLGWMLAQDFGLTVRITCKPKIQTSVAADFVCVRLTTILDLFHCDSSWHQRTKLLLRWIPPYCNIWNLRKASKT